MFMKISSFVVEFAKPHNVLAVSGGTALFAVSVRSTAPGWA
jgi:hypothetical protein